MKKFLSLLVGALLVVFVLAGCAQVRNTPPEIIGASTSVTVYVGDSYDPLAGITATDSQDGDLTSSITVEGYDAAWLNNQGVRTYILSVTDSEGETTQVTVTLTIESGTTNAVPVFTGLFNNQTYYIGSTEYDPIRGVTATDAEDGDLTADITYTNVYSTTRAGKYTITVEVSDSEGAVASETIILTVKAAVEMPAANALDGQKISITLWHSNGDTIEAALNRYADDFEVYMSNTYNATVSVTIYKEADNYDTLRTNIVNLIHASGQLPNIVQGYPDHVMEYIDNRALISVTPYIDDPVWGYGEGNDAFTDILETYRRENCQYTVDGEYYSIPFNKSTEVVIYNKTIFDDLIADGVIDSFPTTWQELFALSDEICDRADDMIDHVTALMNKSSNTALHKTPEEIAEMKANFVPFSYDSPANAFITLLREWGGEYTTINSQREGEILFNSDAAEEMLSFVYENKDIFTVPAYWGSNYASDLFKVGQTAVTIGSTGGARYNTPYYVTYEDENGDDVTEAGFEVGMAPVLYNEDYPEYATAIQQGTNLSITTAGTDLQQLVSWLFLKYLSSADVQLDFALETGYSPVRSSVYQEEEFIQFTNGKVLENGEYVNVVGEDMMKSLAANAAAQEADRQFFDQAFVGSSTARSAVEAAFQRVILSTDTDKTELQIIQEALAAAEAEANRVLGN